MTYTPTQMDMVPKGQTVVDLADMLPGMISLVSLDGHYLFVNQSYCMWVGLSRDKIIGKHVSEIIKIDGDVSEEDRDSLIRRIGETQAEENFEFHIILPSGEKRICQVKIVGHTARSGVYSFIQDITAERENQKWNERLEMEIERRSEELTKFFKVSTDILGAASKDGFFVSLSPSWEEITGWTIEEGLSHPFEHFVYPEDIAASRLVFSDLLNGNPVYGFENRYLHKSGGFRLLQWNVVPDQSQEMLYFVARDITDDRLREDSFRQSQKMEAIGQLTGGIAHDFNNLLMGITGSLDLIERKLPNETKVEIERYIAGAQASAKKAASLTHRLLAFSRRQPLAPITVDANVLVEGMHDLIERTIGTNIEVLFHPDPELWLTLCDPNQLESALLNLILNARDAMIDGGTILIKTMNITPQMCKVRGIPVGEYVKIAVQDAGDGMNAEVKARAFDPFFTTKPLGEGTGLGLSMLHGFVHQSGGVVRIDSELGKGTTVMIYLPKTLLQTHQQPSAEKKPNHKNGSKKSILLVEDEEVIRSLIRDVFIETGHKVETSAEGNSALAILSEKDVDLMITDVGMPGMNGKQLAVMARKIKPDLKILFITGYAAGITLRQELLIDGTDMLLKPFSMDSLQVKVEDMLDNHS